MKTLRIINTSTQEILARQAVIADNFWLRLKGLLGRDEFLLGEGLLIKPCSMVHCLGMKISIDVLFISRSNEIIHIIEKMPPGSISPWVKKAEGVLELPEGQVARTRTRVGQKVKMIQIE
ncbi:MAG: DUF192 domain-containing protein [Syntrophomonadaceae bacterium]|jgi:uncharacterized membrane protein (UPF0127 family)